MYKEFLLTHIRLLAGIHPTGTPVLRGAQLNEFPCMENAWIRIKDGYIYEIGSMDQLPEAVGRVPSESLMGKMVLPAFVDSHTHLVFAENREAEFEARLQGLSYQEIAARGGGILNSVANLRALSEDELLERALIRLAELRTLGTGALEIKSGYGLSTESELKMLRVIRKLSEQSDMDIRATFLGAHAVPGEFSGKTDAYVDHLIRETLPAIATEGLANYVDVFCEKGYFDLAQTERMMEAASKFGLKPRIHVNQFNAFGGVSLAVKHGAVSVDHLEELNEEDLDALSGADTIATALPGCSFFLGIPYTPLRKLIAANAAVSVASDFNPGSAPSGNMQLMLSLACIQQKLTPAEAFNACTHNAAAALEWQNTLGSITPGKRANLMLSPARTLSEWPYAFGSNKVERIMINGIWR